LNFDKPDVADMYDPNGIKRPTDTVIENLTGSFEDSLLTGALGANTEFISTTRVWEPIIERLNEFAGEQDVGFFMRYFSDAGANKFSNPGIAYSEVFNPLTNDNYLRLSGEIYKFVSENQDTLPDDLKGINEELISSLLKQQFDDAQASEQSRSIHNPGPLRATARFAGGTGSSVGDPINLITAPFGGAVVNQGGKLLWKGVASNMLVNAGAAALTESEVADWYEKMGAEYTFEDFVYNVSLNAALGGGLPLVVPGVRMTWQKSKELADILIAKGFKVDAKTQALLDMIDDFEATNDSNPFRRNSALESLDADAAHEEALTAASAAIQDGNAEFIPPAPLLPLKEQPTAPKQKAPLPSGRTVMDVIKDDDAYVVRLNAADLEVDAATFQYKSEGDEFGVTEVLRDEKEWIPSWSGTLTVYEYANGKRVVADGHQRIGFAKRVMAQDPSKNIEVNAIIFREADGVSPEEMRVIAALKNIVEGSGDAVDAAKVLRVDPSALPVLPAKSELVQQARGIRPLSNDSFGMVINGIVPAKYAQYVGDLIKDQNLQDAAMRVLAKSKPENKFQAEAMVRQVRDMPTAEVTQTSLFGDELMTESYFFERSKILNQAYTELRKDKSAFETLVRNSERLEAEGNVLVNDANERKAATDAQTIALLQTLANRKGPLSDALNDAAKTARDTGNYKSARDGFLTAIRRSIDSGDFEGVSAGDIGRSFNGKAEVARDQIAEPELDGFEEPSGIAAEQQEAQLEIDMFGADEVDAPPAAVAQADLEMQSALLEVQDKIQSDWQPYMAMEAGDTLVAMKDIVPVNVRAKGVVNSLGYMVQSANNEIPKRGSLLLRDNGDGTFSVRDGNSTYSIAKAAGWSEVPGKIIDDAQYASELSRKAADRILNQDALGKNKMRYVVAETLGQDEADIFVQKLLERQRFKTGLGLFRKAKKNNETLNKAAAQAAADLGIEFEPAKVKKLKRIEEKVRDKYNGKYNRLTDAARTGINAATIEEADAFVKAMSKKFHLVDEGWKITPAGYVDKKIMVIFDDKSLGEIQIWPPGMLNAKQNPTLFEKSGHDYYEISRSVDSTDVEIADANQKMIEIYGAVTSTLDQSFAQKLGTGAPRASSVDSTLSSGISSEPSSVTTARASSLEPPTGDQPSSVSQIMPSGPSMAKIEPKSNLNNFMDDTSDSNLDIASANVNMDLEIPFESVLGADEQIEVRTMTLRELREEMKKEQAAIARLEFCTI